MIDVLWTLTVLKNRKEFDPLNVEIAIENAIKLIEQNEDRFIDEGADDLAMYRQAENEGY